MYNTFSKEIEVKKKHYGEYTGNHSGYVYSWVMRGKRCQCAVKDGIRGTSSGTVRIDDNGISFIKIKTQATHSAVTDRSR